MIKIEIEKLAEKQFLDLEKSNPQIAKKIDNLFVILKESNDPRIRGKALKGTLKDLWSYKISDYRIIARIIDNVVLIRIIRIEHRNKVYDK